MPITWRNVAAPDFSSSIEGFKTFSNLFGRAIGGAQDGLAAFNATQNAQARNAAILEFAAINDAEQAKARLGAIAADPRLAQRLDAQTIGALQARSGQILAEATAQKTNDWMDNRRARTLNQEGLVDAAQGSVQGYLAAAARGQGDTFMAANPALSALPFDQAVLIGREGQAARANAVNTAGRLQDINFGATRFGWENEDRATASEAEKVLMNLSGNAFDAEGAALALNSMKGVTPKVYNAVMSRIQTMFPSSGGASGILAGAATGGNMDPTRIMNYEAAAAGFKTVPDNIQTLGQASDFATQVNKAGVASSAMGTYQIVGSTLRAYAPKVLGANWQNEGYNQENQDKIAQAIFNDHKGSADALRKQWVSLSAAEAEQVRKLPWEQARQVIAQKESGADPRALALGGAIVQQGRVNASQQRNANSLSPDFLKNAQDFRSSVDVAGSLLKDGAFKGMSQGDISGQIDSILSEAQVKGKNINPALAADILKKSMVRSNVWQRNVPSFFGGGNEAGYSVDSSKASELINSFANGDVDRAAAANANSQIDQGQQAVVQQQYQQALNRYQQGILAARRGVNVPLGQLKAELDFLATAVQGGLQRSGADPALTMFNQAPTPVATRPMPQGLFDKVPDVAKPGAPVARPRGRPAPQWGPPLTPYFLQRR